MKRMMMMMVLCGGVAAAADEGNPAIDFAGFEEVTKEVRDLREQRRVDEATFVRMAREAGTVVLDTRSRAKYEQLHVEGAVHLNFSDFSEASLREAIPTKTTRVLIYCNNNFDGEPQYFVSKARSAALNIPTFIHLHAYGYTEVYELKPYLHVRTTRIPFAGTSVLKAEEK